MSLKFSWDAEVLLPESVEIELAGKTVKFTEFSKGTFDKFLVDLLETKVTEDQPDPENEGKTIPIFKAIPEIIKQQTGLINKWLAKSSGESEEFFKTVEDSLTPWAYGHLVDMLFKINHVDEIAGVRGNYLRLPDAIALVRAEQAQK